MSEQRISNRARVLAIPAVGAAVLGVSIFSRGGSAQDSTATPSASPVASPDASPVADLQTEFKVTAGDIYFDVKEITAPANTDVTITVTNMGSIQHDLVSDDLGVRTPMLNPGDVADVTFNAPAGEYVYYCSVPGHRAAGMEGKIILVDSGAGDGEATVESSVAQNVVAGDIYFDPKEFTIPANTDAEVTVTNIGAAVHDFHIDALGIKTAMLNPGQSEIVTINADAGEYEYYCSVPGHKAAGMVGKVIVE